jgi:ABC-type nitrate/sulfonate/bicarbonate transport system substrate-binding protein
MCNTIGCNGPEESGASIQFLLDWKAQMEHAGFFVASRKGYYREEGLVVEILEGSGAPTTARVVGNGTYVLGVSSGSATVMAKARGIPVVSLAVINQHSPVVVYALGETGIRKPSDLEGKRVGVNIGGTKHREFQAFLRKVGIEESAIRLMGMTEASPAPLLAGRVDAMLGYTEDQPVTVELRGRPVDRIALADYGIDLYSTNIIAHEPFVREQPDIVARFIRASIKGWDYAVEHPDEALAAYMAERPESNREFNRANFEQLIPILHSPDVDRMGLGAQTEARWSHTQDVLYDLDMIERKLPVQTLFTNRFLPAANAAARPGAE